MPIPASQIETWPHQGAITCSRHPNNFRTSIKIAVRGGEKMCHRGGACGVGHDQVPRAPHRRLAGLLHGYSAEAIQGQADQIANLGMWPQT